MDMSEYKKEFISEAQDHLDFLNEGLLVLEKEPDNDENINKLFRSFHTLKGNGAAMGFMKFSELAHSLEDLLSKVRDKEIKPSQDLIDVLLSGIDFLEKGLELINNDDSESLSCEDEVKKIKAFFGGVEQKSDVVISSLIELSDEEKKKIDSLSGEGLVVHRVVIGFESANILKTAKALLILRDLSNKGTILKSVPVQDDIKQGKFSSHIDLLVAIKADKDELSAIINKISGIKELKVLSLDEEFKSSLEKSDGEKDIVKSSDSSDSQVKDTSQSGDVHADTSHIDSVKVDMKSLDSLMNMVGELLISNIRLKDIDMKKEYTGLKTVLTGVDRLIMDLKDEVMNVRMLPIGNIFNRYPRMVRDLSNKQNKKINFVLEGQEIKFDRTVLNEIGDPLIHLLRNSVDHGVEVPEVRLDSGKSEEGIIRLSAKRDKNSAVIELFDDGAGIDAQKVKESSIKKGLISREEADKMSDKELQMLIFRPGTSTNEVITEVSGRGVGMDVVLSKVTSLGGTVSLDSVVGKGTTVKLDLPLTVAIVMVFLVKAKGETYAIPLVNVSENVDIKRKDIKTIRGNKVFLLRGKEVPLFWLSELTSHVGLVSNVKDLLDKSDFSIARIDEFKINKDNEDIFGKKTENIINDSLTVIVINRGSDTVGFVVDEIISQQQILIKALQPCLKNVKGFSGVTILGDGNVSLIIDVNTIL